jgi:hypothetical protein
MPHDRVGERLRAVELLGHGRDLGLGEVAHRPADELMIVRQVEVHADILAGVEHLSIAAWSSPLRIR